MNKSFLLEVVLNGTREDGKDYEVRMKTYMRQGEKSFELVGKKLKLCKALMRKKRKVENWKEMRGKAVYLDAYKNKSLERCMNVIATCRPAVVFVKEEVSFETHIPVFVLSEEEFFLMLQGRGYRTVTFNAADDSSLQMTEQNAKLEKRNGNRKQEVGVKRKSKI